MANFLHFTEDIKLMKIYYPLLSTLLSSLTEIKQRVFLAVKIEFSLILLEFARRHVVLIKEQSNKRYYNMVLDLR